MLDAVAATVDSVEVVAGFASETFLVFVGQRLVVFVGHSKVVAGRSSRFWASF